MDLTKMDRMVEKGLLGDNVGLSTGIVSVNRYLNNFQRGRYMLIGGDSGVGKTTYADYILLSCLRDAIRRGIPGHVKYWSFELSQEDKIMGWICMLMGVDHGFPCTPDYIYGRIPNMRPTQEHLCIYHKARRQFIEEYLPYIDLIAQPMTPTGMFQHLLEFYETIGHIRRDKNREVDGKQVRGRLLGFEPKKEWENGFVLGMIDHVALGVLERGQNLKTMIDAFSRKVVVSRNLMDTSWIVIQQFNTEMNSSYRNVLAKGRIETLISPNRLDFGDSKYTFRDADIVFGLVSPKQYNLSTYNGYDITRLKSNLLIPHLMKHRYGPDGRILPAFINPLTRTVRDMPPHIHEPAMDAIYAEAQKVQEQCLLYFPTNDDLP